MVIPKIFEIFKKLDPGLLNFPETQVSFCNAIEIPESNELENPPTMCHNIIKALREAAIKTIPQQQFDGTIPRWTNDEELSLLIADRDIASRQLGQKSSQFRTLSRKIRKRVSILRNEYYHSEAQKINKYHINRQLEKLFTKAKTQESTFKPVPQRKSTCPPDKLKDHFRQHFDPGPNLKPKPAEIDNPPPYLLNPRQTQSSRYY
jgi:hypothetical protein